jgi:chromosome partitioning protein
MKTGKVISIVNQKGGTGKTTTAVNLGKGLTELGKRVLLIDLDPQANLTYSLAINSLELDINEVLKGKQDIRDAIVEREEMHVIPSDMSLLEFDEYARDIIHQEHVLEEKLSVLEEYDYVLVDCPPTFSLLTINALAASDYALIPLQPDVFSIQGLKYITASIKKIQVLLGSKIKIAGILPVMIDSRRKLTQEVLGHIEENFDVRILKHKIRNNVKASEAPSFGKSVISYAPTANSARDYMAAAVEFNEILEKETIKVEL